MRVVAVIDMPALTVGKGSGGKRREISPQMWAVEIGRVVGRQVAMVYIERVSAMPGQGVTGMFQFGRSLGIAEGVVAALGWPITYMSSAVWKKALGIRVGAGKDDSRAKACQLLPLDAELWTPRRGVVTSAQAVGRAEAALIAYSRRDNSDRRRRGHSHRRRSRASQDW